MSVRVKVSDKEFEVGFLDDAKTEGNLNGVPFQWDVSRIGEGVYHIIKDNRSYNVELLEEEDGKRRVKVNGTIYETHTIDRFEELLKRLGMEKGGGSKVNELKAPMPGLVLSIDVKAGDVLQKGDRIGIVEAASAPARGRWPGAKTQRGIVYRRAHR